MQPALHQLSMCCFAVLLCYLLQQFSLLILFYLSCNNLPFCFIDLTLFSCRTGRWWGLYKPAAIHANIVLQTRIHQIFQYIYYYISRGTRNSFWTKNERNHEIYHFGGKTDIHNFGWNLDENGQLIAEKVVKFFHIHWRYHNAFTAGLKERMPRIIGMWMD